MTERRELAHGGHPGREPRVHRLRIALREVGEVHARGRVLVHLDHEVPVQLLGQERCERCEELRHLDEARPERPVGGGLVRHRLVVVRRAPEATPRPPDVPVRQVVDELDDAPARGERVEAL
jgi:hypothetical protein